MRDSIREGVARLQTLAVEHSTALWDVLADADPETPAEANMLLGAYMGSLTEHVQQRSQETTGSDTNAES